jgi:transposase
MPRVLPAALDLNSLPTEVAPLQELVIGLARELESLHQQLMSLRRLHFGAKSEQLSALQGDLFGGSTVSLPLPPKATATVSYERTVSKGRPRLPKDLPRMRIDYELSAAERTQFDTVERIGEEISETLDYTAPQLIVVEHVRGKYRCEKAGESTIRVAQAEPSPLPKANASAGLLAQVLTAKYADGLPLNRQEKIFKRHGVELPRATLCDWVLGATELLAPLLEPLKTHILAAPVIFADDTTLDLLEPGRGKTRTARLWAYVSAGESQDSEERWHRYPKAALFEFTATREAEHPSRFLKNYTGYLQADDYAGYQESFRSGHIVHAACWAHARRKLYDIAKAQKRPGLAHEAMQFIAKLYAIEAQIRDQPVDERCSIRQRETVPLLEEFKAWLEAYFPTLLPQGPLAQAFGYVLSNWQALLRFTERGYLAPDTNLVERTIRPVAVGRKAWLFAGSTRGGDAAAVAFSLIETAKLNAIEPFAYLKDVLSRIRAHRTDRLAELLPFNWKPAL